MSNKLKKEGFALSYEEVFCRCCGQRCQPVKTMRPAEDYDGPASCSRLVEDWVSDCCGDALSRVAVTDQCVRCGVVAVRGDEFPQTPQGKVHCPACLTKYQT